MERGSGRKTVLVICYLAFVSLGLPDPLIGVAWPSVRENFGLRQSDIAWVFAGNGCAYFLSSTFAGRLLKVMNVGVLLGVSSGLVALAAFDFGLARAWGMFAAGALFHGLGSGAIDAGLNHYVASHFSARHMTWLHACYSAGAMLGPLVMTTAIARMNGWRAGYLIVGGMLATLAAIFFLSAKLWDPPERAAEPKPQESPRRSGLDALKVGAVWGHIILFFVYTGVEFGIGQWSYTILTEARGIARDLAGYWVTVYWAGILAGRILFGFIVERIGADRLIQLSSGAAVVGTGIFAFSPWRGTDVLALGIAGIGVAAIFPSLMTRTPERFGKEMSAHVIGFQIGASMLGAAGLPSGMGVVAQHAGLELVAPLIFGITVLFWMVHEAVLAQTGQSK